MASGEIDDVELNLPKCDTRNLNPTRSGKMNKKFCTVGLLALVSLASQVVTLSAEIGTGGGGGGVAACLPISSLTVKGDGKVGETGLGSVQMGWGVKPCDASQAVNVTVTIANYTTKAVVYTDGSAPLNGKITVAVPSRQLYLCTVTVVDVATGAVIQTRSTTVSTTPKGGV